MRQARLVEENAYYHVMVRGNNKEIIFRDRADYTQFIYGISEARKKESVKIVGFALMPNHVHFIIWAKDGKALSKFMHRIQTRYGGYYNSRYRGRVGHVFQGRFKSIIVAEDAYLLQLSRYIHLNPVEAHLVAKPEQYPWSSYRHYLGLEDYFDFVETAIVLDLLTDQFGFAQQEYQAFIEGQTPR
jgi:putative transposase